MPLALSFEHCEDISPFRLKRRDAAPAGPASQLSMKDNSHFSSIFFAHRPSNRSWRLHSVASSTRPPGRRPRTSGAPSQIGDLSWQVLSFEQPLACIFNINHSVSSLSERSNYRLLVHALSVLSSNTKPFAFVTHIIFPLCQLANFSPLKRSPRPVQAAREGVWADDHCTLLLLAALYALCVACAAAQLPAARVSHVE